MRFMLSGGHDSNVENELYLTADADEYIKCINNIVGFDVIARVSQLIAPVNVVGVCAVGSIPIGVGTNVSDADLIFITDSQNVILDSTEEFISIFRGELDLSVGEDGRCINWISMASGLELDVLFLSSGALQKIQNRVSQSNNGLTRFQRRIYGRISTGWTLYADDVGRSIIGQVRDDWTLRVSASVSDFVLALQAYDDAVISSEERSIVGLYQARNCLISAFAAVSASYGYTDAGNKWPRMYEKKILRPNDVNLFSDGSALISWEPRNLDREEMSLHLEKVRLFLDRASKELCREPQIEYALCLCPQLTEIQS